MVIDVFDTKIKEQYGLSGFGAFDIVSRIALIAGSLVAARSRSHRIHAIWGVAFAVIMSVFECVNFGALRAD